MALRVPLAPSAPTGLEQKAQLVLLASVARKEPVALLLAPWTPAAQARGSNIPLAWQSSMARLLAPVALVAQARGSNMPLA